MNTNPLKDFESSLASIELTLKYKTGLRRLAETEEWKLLEGIIGKLVNARIADLLVPGTGHERTIELRAIANTLRMLLDIPKVNPKEFEHLANRAKDLRKRIERLHTLGIGSTAGRNEIDAIKSELAETKSLIGETT